MAQTYLRTLLCIAVAASCQLPARSAQAGGIQLWELGTPDLGLAAAGWSARAQDAATLFKNPAGMNQLEVPQLEIGLQALYGKFEFQSANGTTVDGNDGGNAVGFLPGASLFWAQQVTDVVAVGIGVFSYFGSALSYDDDFVGRYDVEETLLFGFSLMPAVSFQITDWLSLGAGFNIMLGFYDYKVGINNRVPTAPDFPDGRLAVDDTDVGFGADVGILFSLSDRTRLGMTYLSPVKLEFNMKTDFSGLSPLLETVLDRRGLLDSTINANIKVPQSLVLSVYHDFNEKWALMGNVGWQDWSEFGLIGIALESEDDASLVINRQYKDTAHVAIGTRVRPVSPVAVSLGFGYDSSAVNDANRTLDAPMGQAFRLGTGVEWLIIPAVQLGFAYTLVWMGDMPVEQLGGPLNGDVIGSFENTAIHVAASNLQWTIGAKK